MKKAIYFLSLLFILLTFVGDIMLGQNMTAEEYSQQVVINSLKMLAVAFVAGIIMVYLLLKIAKRDRIEEE